MENGFWKCVRTLGVANCNKPDVHLCMPISQNFSFNSVGAVILSLYIWLDMLPGCNMHAVFSVQFYIHFFTRNSHTDIKKLAETIHNFHCCCCLPIFLIVLKFIIVASCLWHSCRKDFLFSFVMASRCWPIIHIFSTCIKVWYKRGVA